MFRLLIIGLGLVCVVSQVVNAVEESELASMSPKKLKALEERLTRDIAASDRELKALKKQTESLRQEQETIDEEAGKLSESNKHEAEEKEAREKELDLVREEVKRKQESISRMTVRVSELKASIGGLEERLRTLTREKLEVERRYQEPSLTDVLDSRAGNWGVIPRTVYNRTRRDIGPALTELSYAARQYRTRVRKRSRALELLSSLIVYGFLLSAGYVVYKVYCKVKGNFTVDRLLLIGDLYCACFWMVVMACYCLLGGDPLYVMHRRSPRTFFAFQLVAMCAYTFHVLLRVLVLASEMHIAALGETLAVIVLGQHYYVRTWQPAVLNLDFENAFFYYFIYAWTFAAFSVNRIDEFSPLQHLKGSKLSLLSSLRILRARVMRRDVPNGDLETTLPANS